MLNLAPGRAAIVLTALVGIAQDVRGTEPSAGETPLVLVNGRAITQADLQTAYLVRGVPPDRQPALRRPLLERLIDERLIDSFLERRRIKPNAAALDTQVERIIALIRSRGEEPDELLARLGLDRQQIRDQLSLPLAWQGYAREVMTDAQIESFYDAHRRELDGTQIRARHILIKVPADAPAAAWEQATDKLKVIRREIETGQTSFADAAREHSEAPSGRRGGDVGFFASRGTMPPAFAEAAFRLKPEELSRPVRTNVGMHLIEVTDERPGQLSLEDVRPVVLERLADSLWDEQVAAERDRATIVWSRPEDADASP